MSDPQRTTENVGLENDGPSKNREEGGKCSVPSDSVAVYRSSVSECMAIMWHYLRHPKFSGRFDTIPACERYTETDKQTDRQTDRHTTTANTRTSITSRGKNSLF